MTEAIQIAPAFRYAFICRDAYGIMKWCEHVHNIVTASGKNDIINQYFKGVSYNAAWYIGLKSAGVPSSSDTLASHAGWNEITPYSGNRPAIMFGTTAGGSNTANAVNISINSGMAVSGAFIASASSGATGILYSVSDFSILRTVASGDTLSVIPAISVL